MRLTRPTAKVWLNRSIFPVDLISIAPPTGKALKGVQLGYGHANDIFKLRSGDGEDLGTVGPHQSIDLFVHDGRDSYLELPPLRMARLLSIGPGRPLVITASWAGVEENAPRTTMCILWTYEERLTGHRPRLAFGSEAEMLIRYTGKWEKSVTGELLSLRRRVPMMRRRDAIVRARRETRGSNMAGDQKSLVRATSISVAGFRGFREEAELRLSQPSGKNGSGLTIVVGANNTGKSTIWESFDALARKLKSDVSFSEGQRNRQASAGVRIVLRRTDGSAYILASQSKDTSETTGYWENSAGYDSVEIVSVPSRRRFEASFSKGTNSQRDWMMTGGQGFRRESQPISGFTGRLFDLHNNPIKKADFDTLMAEVIGYPLRWTIDLGEGQHGQSYYLKVTTGESVDHTSEGLGDGIISLLFILNALYDSKPGSLLLFDEPELSLHPQFVRRLGRIFARYSSDRQIVVFTHSPLLVSWDDIEAGAEIARVYKTGADSQIAQPSRTVIDEISKVRGGRRNPHVLGLDANEALFLDDEIIVVEGQEDAVLLPVVFDQTGVARRGTVFGWGSGGGDGGPRRIVALLAGLGFKKVVALLDADKPGEVAAIQREFPNYLATVIPAHDIRDKPAKDFKGKEGLLDERGKIIKPALKDATQAVLTSVIEYLAKSSTELENPTVYAGDAVGTGSDPV